MPSEAAAYLYSPLGMLALRGTDAGVRAVQFQSTALPGKDGSATPTLQISECLREACRQLEAYFGGELQTFCLPLDVQNGTDFQRQVWATLPSIGYGQTASYLDVARRLHNAGAVRAVGAANGQNPLAIIWPCHRIIGANGQLTGYAGGLLRKRWLLDFERPSQQGSLF